MSIPPFQYPVIGFGRPHDMLEHGEDIHAFEQEKNFTFCGPWTVKHSAAIGMLLVDQGGKAWEVIDASYVERKQNLWQRMFKPNWFDMTLTFEPRPPMPLDVLKERVCAAIEAEPWWWEDEELTAGEAGEPIDTEVQIAELTRKVRGVNSSLELIDILCLGDPLQ